MKDSGNLGSRRPEGYVDCEGEPLTKEVMQVGFDKAMSNHNEDYGESLVERAVKFQATGFEFIAFDDNQDGLPDETCDSVRASQILGEPPTGEDCYDQVVIALPDGRFAMAIWYPDIDDNGVWCRVVVGDGKDFELFLYDIEDPDSIDDDDGGAIFCHSDPQQFIKFGQDVAAFQARVALGKSLEGR